MSVPPGVWLDERPLSRSWPEPVPPLQVPAWARIGLPLLVLAALVAAVVGFGGLEQRRDQVQVVAPGVPVDCKNLVFALESATVQRATQWDDSIAWTVRVHGTVSNPNDEPLRPRDGPSGNLALVPGEPLATVTELEGYTIGEGEDSVRRAVPPGGAAFPLELEFVLPEEFTPRDVIHVGLVESEFTDNSVLDIGGGEKTWNGGDQAYSVYLPVTVLAEDVY
ncbi:hypothetical protein [Desertihabitans aurantiacus]|uniref:hypothetical protein n=1 Tax=Desertihabitans aurantiacus TaxID=2282477 RepID=UPI000DF769C8|nr:hypothetical protein [Desertihabitans aurantiacus]